MPTLLARACAVLLATHAAHAQPASDSGHAQSLARARALSPLVTITRDEFGIPHVQAPTDAGAVFGAMYARAEDEMSRIESAHTIAIGRASLELGAAALTWDRFVLSFEIPDLARRECDAAPPDVRAIAQGAADALNLYQDLHPDYRPKAIEHWEPWMLFAREYAWALYQVQEEVQRVIEAHPLADARAPTSPKPAEPAPEKRAVPDGSNAWAIAGSRTASGRAMLYINPHIPLDEPYEMELRSGEGLHIYGGAAYGAGLLPFAGFNDHLGWSLTVNYPDIVDSYAIEFNTPGDALAYTHGGETLHATQWTSKVSVRTDAGVIEEELTFYKTIQGPVLYQAGGTSFAFRVARTESLRAVEQWYRMAKARSRQEWLDAVSIFGVVFHNLVYADGAGNIGYIYNAAFPHRDPAFDWSGTLDGADPRTEWKGYHTLDEIPQVWNPPSGYLLSCNSPPFNVTAAGENPERVKFPAYMVGRDLTDGRIAMSHDILSKAKAWTLDDLERAAFDTKVYSLEPSRAALIADLTKLKASNPEVADRLAPAVKLIRAWEGRLALESVESTLFMVWIEKVFTPPWASRRAPGDMCSALAEVMTELERDFGTWRVKWGEINRHQRFDTNGALAVSDSRDSLPIVGGHGSMGVGFCYLTRATGTKRRYGYHGHSFVGAVEFGDVPSARSIIPFGESRDPASPHFNDQAPIYAGGHLKAVHFGPGRVAGAVARTYHPGEAAPR